MLARWQFTIKEKNNLIQRFLMKEDKLSIGRDEQSCDIVIHHNNISRIHAYILLDQGELKIVDAGSKNGITIDGKRIKEAPLKHGSEVRLANFTLICENLDEHTTSSSQIANTPPPPKEDLSEEPKKPHPQQSDHRPKISPPKKSLSSDIEEATPPFGTVLKQNDLSPPRVATPQKSAAEFKEVIPPDQFPEIAADVLAPEKNKYPALEEMDTDESLTAAPSKPFSRATADKPVVLEHNPHKEIYDEDDDEEEDLEYTEQASSFSLVAPLLRPQSEPLKELMVELILFQGEDIIDYACLNSASLKWQGAASSYCGLMRCAFFEKTSEVELILNREAQGYGLSNNTQTPLSDLAVEYQGCWKITLRVGQSLHLQAADFFLTLQFIAKPRLNVLPASDQENYGQRLHKWALLGSLLMHITMGAGVSWIPPATPAPVVKEEFTLIYKPPASPKPQPPPPPKPKKIVRPPTKVVKKVVKKSVAHKLPSMRKKVSPPKAQQHAKAFKSKSLKPPPPKPQKVTAPTPPGILGLLQKSQHLAAPGESAAVAAVSHLTHVDSSSHMGYRVSGLAAKLPPGEQVRTGGGSGEMVTSGRSVITGGAGHLVKARGNRVEGLVQELPEDVSTGGSGLLDRHEIDKVVAQHQHEISRCYERELLHNASIQGKLQVEWIINPNGRVISVKQQTSSIKNNKLIKCIMNRIKTWHFPPPRGGSVVVNYPFLLKSIDF